MHADVSEHDELLARLAEAAQAAVQDVRDSRALELLSRSSPAQIYDLFIEILQSSTHPAEHTCELFLAESQASDSPKQRPTHPSVLGKAVFCSDQDSSAHMAPALGKLCTTGPAIEPATSNDTATKAQAKDAQQTSCMQQPVVCRLQQLAAHHPNLDISLDLQADEAALADFDLLAPCVGGIPGRSQPSRISRMVLRPRLHHPDAVQQVVACQPGTGGHSLADEQQRPQAAAAAYWSRESCSSTRSSKQGCQMVSGLAISDAAVAIGGTVPTIGMQTNHADVPLLERAASPVYVEKACNCMPYNSLSLTGPASNVMKQGPSAKPRQSAVESAVCWPLSQPVHLAAVDSDCEVDSIASATSTCASHCSPITAAATAYQGQQQQHHQTAAAANAAGYRGGGGLGRVLLGPVNALRRSFSGKCIPSSPAGAAALNVTVKQMPSQTAGGGAAGHAIMGKASSAPANAASAAQPAGAAPAAAAQSKLPSFGATAGKPAGIMSSRIPASGSSSNKAGGSSSYKPPAISGAPAKGAASHAAGGIVNGLSALGRAARQHPAAAAAKGLAYAAAAGTGQAAKAEFNVPQQAATVAAAAGGLQASPSTNAGVAWLKQHSEWQQVRTPPPTAKTAGSKAARQQSRHVADGHLLAGQLRSIPASPAVSRPASSASNRCNTPAAAAAAAAATTPALKKALSGTAQLGSTPAALLSAVTPPSAATIGRTASTAGATTAGHAAVTPVGGSNPQSRLPGFSVTNQMVSGKQQRTPMATPITTPASSARSARAAATTSKAAYMHQLAGQSPGDLIAAAATGVCGARPVHSRQQSRLPVPTSATGAAAAAATGAGRKQGFTATQQHMLQGSGHAAASWLPRAGGAHTSNGTSKAVMLSTYAQAQGSKVKRAAAAVAAAAVPGDSEASQLRRSRSCGSLVELLQHQQKVSQTRQMWQRKEEEVKKQQQQAHCQQQHSHIASKHSWLQRQHSSHGCGAEAATAVGPSGTEVVLAPCLQAVGGDLLGRLDRMLMAQGVMPAPFDTGYLQQAASAQDTSKAQRHGPEHAAGKYQKSGTCSAAAVKQRSHQVMCTPGVVAPGRAPIGVADEDLLNPMATPPDSLGVCSSSS